MKKFFVCVVLSAFLGNHVFAQPTIFNTQSVLKNMEKVADWQLNTWKMKGMRWPMWDWTNGACYTGFMALNKISNNRKYIDAMMGIGNSLQWNTGPSRTMADDYCIGQMYSQMYQLYKLPEMIAHFKPLADSIVAAPHAESLEWKNSIQLREWAWCDALFMGPTALAYLYTATGEKKYMDAADKLWWKTTDYLFDTTEHLFTRDSRYFEKKEANGKKVFWSRGNGWVMGGMVRMLENMPSGHPSRNRLVNLYTKMVKKIASIQHTDGTWHTALLDSLTYPAKETSGTGFYCYALAYGINNGLLNYNEYYPVVAKAWQALIASIHEDGTLGYVQEINEKPGVVDYNSSASYGVGAFLLAGSQMAVLCLNQSGNKTIQLSNKTGLERREEVVTVPIQYYHELVAGMANKDLVFANAFTGEKIPFQLVYKGGQVPVNILFQVSMSPGASIYIKCLNEKPIEMIAKTYARYIPERYDDFAWENDRIAFRMYGKALELTKENAYGMDVWVKRTDKLVINERYKRGQYHIDHGDGLDYYHVGFSLGAGNIAGYKNDSIYFSKNYRNWKILDSGILRTTFQLNYDEWNIAGNKVSAVKTISLDAGSQLNKMEVSFKYNSNDTLPLVVGLIKRDQQGTLYLNEQDGIMGYWEPASISNGTTGTGVVFPNLIQSMEVKKGHLLSKIHATKKSPLVYYVGAAWDRAEKITNSEQWINYLRQYKKQIDYPIEVSFLKLK